jgi:hypothetical protein
MNALAVDGQNLIQAHRWQVFVLTLVLFFGHILRTIVKRL